LALDDFIFSYLGGDNIIQAVFRYCEAIWAGIQAGQPHCSYGNYTEVQKILSQQ